MGAKMAAELDAKTLSPLVNEYLVKGGKTKTIIVPNASRLVGFQDITVGGMLLKKQLVALDTSNNKRTARLAANGGRYTLQSGDGDLHFCLGTEQGQPHIACEIQNAKSVLSLFNKSIGQPITVSGFFRCLFEHPGFRGNDDAHIFEIHPVRAVQIGGKTHSFDVDVPEQGAIHTWTDPHNLNDQDDAITAKYDKPTDRLTFSGMSGQDENYVSVSGTIGQINVRASGSGPAECILDSKAVGHPIKVYCLQGTRAASQLRGLKDGAKVKMIALRNIDLPSALKGTYKINLLGINFQ
jgi:hypothetical protein